MARKYQAFYELFSPEMKKAITLETYSQQADQILALGTPESIGEASVQTVQSAALVTIPVHWRAVSLNFLVSWNQQGKIQGTFFRPSTREIAWAAPNFARVHARAGARGQRNAIARRQGDCR